MKTPVQWQAFSTACGIQLGKFGMAIADIRRCIWDVIQNSLQGENPCPRRSHFETYSRVSLRLFALTVKYTLHPLSVEDVIEQCQTKIDRLGGHYFLTIEPIGNLAVTFDIF